MSEIGLARYFPCVIGVNSVPFLSSSRLPFLIYTHRQPGLRWPGQNHQCSWRRFGDGQTTDHLRFPFAPRVFVPPQPYFTLSTLASQVFDALPQESLASTSRRSRSPTADPGSLDPQDLLLSFRSFSSAQRFAFLSALVGELRQNEALVVSRRIEPRLKRDFLRELPVELALHCLSFVCPCRVKLRLASSHPVASRRIPAEHLCSHAKVFR